MTIAIFRKILFKNVIHFYNVQRTGKNCKKKKKIQDQMSKINLKTKLRKINKYFECLTFR